MRFLNIVVALCWLFNLVTLCMGYKQDIFLIGVSYFTSMMYFVLLAIEGGK